jgi:hypothetical protein
MQLDVGATLAEARALAMAELPSDATVVFFVVQENTPTGSCAILELRSATLVPILSAPGIGGDGTVDFVMSNIDAQGKWIYNPNDIGFMNVSIGLGLASAQSGAC